MKPCSIPASSSRTAASGARALVVQDAFETMVWAAGSYASLLTPYASVTSAPAEGALTRTFRAPAVRWARAASAEVKRPVDSRTMSTSSSAHGSRAGSRSARTLMRRPSTTRVSPSTLTGRPSLPAVESKASRRASAAGSVRSLTATISTLESRSSSARSTLRPIRPNPLMPMRVISVCPFVSPPDPSPPLSRAPSTGGSGTSAMVRKDRARALPHRPGRPPGPVC